MSILNLLKTNYLPTLTEYVSQHNEYCKYINQLLADLCHVPLELKKPPKLLQSGSLDKASRDAFNSIVKLYSDTYPTTGCYISAYDKNIVLSTSRGVLLPCRFDRTQTHYFKTVVGIYDLKSHKPLTYTMTELESERVKSALALLIESEDRIEQWKKEVRRCEYYLTGTNLTQTTN